VAVCYSLPVDDSDEDRYATTPRSPVPVAPKKRRNWLSCVKKQTSDENPLVVNKVGASPSDLADSRVSQFSSAQHSLSLVKSPVRTTVYIKSNQIAYVYFRQQSIAHAKNI